MNRTPRILLVDDEEWNLQVLRSHLGPEGYDLVNARNGEEALHLVSSCEFDLILLDVMMPDRDGFQVCRAMKARPHLQSVPVILVTALRDTFDKVVGLEAGAADFLSKPIEKAELIARVHAHLRLKFLLDEMDTWNKTLEQKVEARTKLIDEKKKELDESYHQTIEALITSLDIREHETGNHSLRVAFYTTEMAAGAGIRGKSLEEVAMGALLHDIGKIGVSDLILRKPGKLTDEEWVQMKKHPEIGWRIIKDIEFIGIGRELVLSHQERYDGSGYPRGLKGEGICQAARFFAVVDTFDAVTSERSYKKPQSFEILVDILKQGAGTLFDPRAADLFLSVPKGRWGELRQSVEQSNFRHLIREIRSRYA